jgi:hypothetical protein
MFSAFGAIGDLASVASLWLPAHNPAALQRFPSYGTDIASLNQPGGCGAHPAIEAGTFR